MFEYLMPMLVMPSYENTLLDQTCAGRRARQIATATARRALGHFRIRLQHGRRASQLPVPRLRRAGAGAQARARGGSGRRALRHGAGPDGVARSGLPESAAPGRRGRCSAPSASSRRSTTRRPGSRAGRTQGHRALLHGAPPGHELARARAYAPRPADAAALRVRPAVPGDPAAAAGTHPRTTCSSARPPRWPKRGSDLRRRNADPRLHAPTPRRPKCSCCRTAATT
jgi:hypothetical protein